jgi:hypothetical protein
MIYTIAVVVTANTKTNKLELVTDEKRIVITPVTRTGKDAFVVVNDRPVATPQYVADLLRFLIQNLYGKEQISRIAREIRNDDTST